MIETLNRITPSFRTAPVFLPLLYKSFAFKTLNATFPFPQVFSLSPFPLAREPTVTAWRGTTLGRDITNAISLIMPLRFVRRLRINMAQSLVLYVKSDARYGRRLAAPTGKTVGTRIDKYRTLIMPLVRKCKEQHALAHLYKPSCSALTSNKHIPFIRTLRISFRFGCGCPAQINHQADNLAKLRQEFLSLLELIAKIFGAVSRTISLMRPSALLASKLCRCRNDGFCFFYPFRIFCKSHLYILVFF